MDTMWLFQFFHRDLRAIVFFVLKPSACGPYQLN
jgi:hypothetical protein